MTVSRVQFARIPLFLLNFNDYPALNMEHKKSDFPLICGLCFCLLINKNLPCFEMRTSTSLMYFKNIAILLSTILF